MSDTKVEEDDALAPLLPRELTSIADEVRAVSAPPTPKLPQPYAIRQADPVADAHLIAEWMNRPHLVEAWEYAWPPARWRRHLQAQVDGQYSRPFIGSFDAQPFVYLELYRAAKDSIAPCYDADPYDIGLHVAIAETQFVNRGIAPMMLPRLVDSIFELEPRCRRIMFDPDHRNAKARAVCEHAGSAFLGEYDMSNRRMALYALMRSAQSSSQRGQ
jgi:RimJ/RimL family protein N-acetyltransferase